jgi:hypothetical protein
VLVATKNNPNEAKTIVYTNLQNMDNGKHHNTASLLGDQVAWFIDGFRV